MYTHEELCELHDEYMMFYDALIETSFEGILTSTYSELMEIKRFNKSPEVQAACNFMLIYKQNVYAIDNANDKRKYN